MPLPTVILPGYLASAAPYSGMEQALQSLGYPVLTVPLTRWDWVPTVGGKSVATILTKLDQSVQQLLAKTGAHQVNLVGHSAGGWIARIYLGEVPYTVSGWRQTPAGAVRTLWQAHPQVHTLITLGTPHTSQERWTRTNLEFVNQTYPGAFYPTVRYVCIAGKAIYGKQDWQGWFTYNSYAMTCGQGGCWGDGITPVSAAHLEGAENVLLEDVYHSPRPGMKWYGSADIVKAWSTYLA